jgi:hypothetical protein
MSYETLKTMSDLQSLREARDHTAWEAMIASIDAMRAHMDDDPDAPALRRIARDRVYDARDACARYWQAYARENRREK